jgi:hypothetical protein
MLAIGKAATVNIGHQGSLFGELQARAKPIDRSAQRLSVLITVKASPNPSAQYGETVCVAGLSTELERPSWIRLYPINFRHLEQDIRFSKYDIVEVDAFPSAKDPRVESWRPQMDTLRVIRSVKPWKPRRVFLDPVVEPSMCAVYQRAKTDARAPSLALISASRVDGFDIELHPGWTRAEQLKIDAYVNQLELFTGQDKSPLYAPRFRGFYRWHCHEPTCSGHRQGIIDWEFVALQRKLRHLDNDQSVQALKKRFLTEICHSSKDLAFYVGNQAKRHQTFSILGAYYPGRT